MRINAGDTAFVLMSAALVMLMTPGLALFYGGMVRAKNVLAMLMQNFFCLGLISVLWAVCMYSLAFHGTGKWIGNLDLAFLDHANTIPATGFGAVPIPPLSFSAFQMMFAVITPALITGATADRLKFGAEARYQWDKIAQQQIYFTTGSPKLSKTFKSFSPRITADYSLTENSLLYANYSRGYRPGGFNASQSRAFFFTYQEAAWVAIAQVKYLSQNGDLSTGYLRNM